jgi:hypothetical protein
VELTGRVWVRWEDSTVILAPMNGTVGVRRWVRNSRAGRDWHATTVNLLQRR